MYCVTPAIFHFPKGCFYENVYARFGSSAGDAQQYSATYHVHDPTTPIHEAFDIALKPLNLPDSLRSKAFVAYCQRDDARTYSCGGTWDASGFLTARNNRFGNYSIEIDRTPPTITPVSFGDKMVRSARMSFRIRDNIEGRGVTYRAELDGKWLLMELDGKSDLLYCALQNDQITEGVEHTLNITATDDRGNVTVFEDDFTVVERLEKPRSVSAKASKKRKRK